VEFPWKSNIRGDCTIARARISVWGNRPKAPNIRIGWHCADAMGIILASSSIMTKNIIGFYGGYDNINIFWPTISSVLL